MDPEPKKPTEKGSGEHFTGDVWIDSIVEPEGDSTLHVVHVHFAPGARTAWHCHPGGQTLYVTEGRGRVQTRGGSAPVELRPGDVHRTPHGHEHWHGAAHDHLMSHMSITQAPAEWGEHVTDDEYGAIG